MRNWMLGTFAVAIVLGVLLLLWNLRSEEKASQAQTQSNATLDQDARPSALPTSSGSGTSSGTKIQPPADTEDPKPLRPEELTIELDRYLKREIPRRIRAAASPCFDSSKFSSKQLENSEAAIEFNYTLRVKSGFASLRNVKLTQGISPGLDACVMRIVSALEWEDTSHGEFTVESGDEITLLGLKKFGAPMPHEVEEVPEDPSNSDF